MSTPARSGAAGSARVRLVVLAMLLGGVVGATALAASLVEPSGPGAAAPVTAVLAVHAALHALALRAAVSPWVEDRARTVLAAGLLAATLLAWPVLTATAGPGDEPWAWLLGFTVGALAVLRRRVAVAAAVVGAGLVVAGPVVLGTGTARDGLVFAGLGAVTAGGFALLLVWMLGVLVRAEEGRSAQARLAVAEERLRVSRELHDVLGHRLGVIALRAELAGDAETEDLARRTLHEVRAAVHGYATVDLPEQLRGAELVLGSAGIATTVTATPVTATSAPLAAGTSQLLAAAVREAVTNVLRHSAARRCRIVLEEDGGVVRLTVENDGVPAARAGTGPGTGLAGLAERARGAGARLRAGADGEEFRLVVEVPR